MGESFKRGMIDILKGNTYTLILLFTAIYFFSNNNIFTLTKACHSTFYCYVSPWAIITYVIAVFMAWLFFISIHKLGSDEIRDDEIARLQKEKLKLEIKNLKTTQSNKPKPSVRAKRKRKAS